MTVFLYNPIIFIYSCMMALSDGCYGKQEYKAGITELSAHTSVNFCTKIKSKLLITNY
jgi:hypothetical protein